MPNQQQPLSQAEVQAMAAAGLQADQQGLQAQEQAVDTAVQQQTTVDTASVTQRYQSGLADVVEAKVEQVDRIEDRLESQIEAQETRLQSLASNRPGLLSRPGAREAWQAQQLQQQQVLQRLQGRLEAVREVRDTMGVNGSKIQELAERRFRTREPELAQSWDDMRAAQRAHEALQRKQEQDRRRQQGQGLGLSLTRSLKSE